MSGKLLEKSPKLTRKQKAFADELLADKTISLTEAAARAYPDVKDRMVARNVAVKNMANAGILAYLNEHDYEAQTRIVELMRNAKDEVALKASQDILDRVHGKAIQQIQTESKHLVIQIDLGSVQS